MAKNNFAKAFNNVEKAIKKTTVSTLNKALSKTLTYTKRELRQETGLNNERIEKRITAYKATLDKPKASIRIATKVGIQLRYFKPQEKRITKRVTYAISKNGVIKKAYKSRFHGVTVKIGKQPRQLVPGGFMRIVKGQGLVLARKDRVDGEGSYTPGKSARRPLTVLRTKVFSKAAEQVQDKANKYMKDILVDIYTDEMAKHLTKAIK